MPCWQGLLSRNEGNALDDHQRKNDQCKDDSIAKQAPGEGQVIPVAGDDIDQQTCADRDNQDDRKQTQQPHAGLCVLIQPAGHADWSAFGFVERHQFPGLLLIEKFAGQHVVQCVAALV